MVNDSSIFVYGAKDRYRRMSNGTGSARRTSDSRRQRWGTKQADHQAYERQRLRVYKLRYEASNAWVQQIKSNGSAESQHFRRGCKSKYCKDWPTVQSPHACRTKSVYSVISFVKVTQKWSGLFAVSWCCGDVEKRLCNLISSVLRCIETYLRVPKMCNC